MMQWLYSYLPKTFTLPAPEESLNPESKSESEPEVKTETSLTEEKIEELTRNINTPGLETNVNSYPKNQVTTYGYDALTGVDYHDIYVNIKKIYDKKQVKDDDFLAKLEKFGLLKNFESLINLFGDGENDITEYVKKAEAEKSKKYSLYHLSIVVLLFALYKKNEISKLTFILFLSGVFAHYIKYITEKKSVTVDYTKTLDFIYHYNFNTEHYLHIIITELQKIKKNLGSEIIEIVDIIETEFVKIKNDKNNDGKQNLFKPVFKIIFMIKKFLHLTISSDETDVVSLLSFFIENRQYLNEFKNLTVEQLTNLKNIINAHFTSKSRVASPVKSYIESFFNADSYASKLLKKYEYSSEYLDYLIIGFNIGYFINEKFNNKKINTILFETLKPENMEIFYRYFVNIKNLYSMINSEEKSDIENEFFNKMTVLVEEKKDTIRGVEIMDSFIQLRKFYELKLLFEISSVLEYFNLKFGNVKPSFNVSRSINTMFIAHKKIYFDFLLKKYDNKYAEKYKTKLLDEYKRLNTEIYEKQQTAGGETGIWWFIIILIICIIILIILIIIYKFGHGRSIAIT